MIRIRTLDLQIMKVFKQHIHYISSKFATRWIKSVSRSIGRRLEDQRRGGSEIGHVCTHSGNLVGIESTP